MKESGFKGERSFISSKEIITENPEINNASIDDVSFIKNRRDMELYIEDFKDRTSLPGEIQQALLDKDSLLREATEIKKEINNLKLEEQADYISRFNDLDEKLGDVEADIEHIDMHIWRLINYNKELKQAYDKYIQSEKVRNTMSNPADPRLN